MCSRVDRPRRREPERPDARLAEGPTLPAAVARPVVWSLYAMLVLIWSSTWLAIKLGLEDVPPLLGAGIRFALAGALLLLVSAVRRRSLRSDPGLVVLLAALPFAVAYGLIYFGEQHIPSGLAAVLFGVMPLYSAALATLLLADERPDRRLVTGIGVAIAGLAVAYSESLALGDDELAPLGAAACLVAPLASAVGNVAIKRRAALLDAVVLNGWAMLLGGGLLLAASLPGEDWGAAEPTAQAVGSVLYLALVGSAVPFVVLTILLRELPAVTMSYVALLLPFGALAVGAVGGGEALTAPALAGAALVAAGLVVARR
jgi:drug/metabolite transporter (DMT)-like permease